MFKTEEKYCMTSPVCGLKKKMIQMNLLTLENIKRLADLENELFCQGKG